MEDYQRPPIIINLGECNRGTDVAEIVKQRYKSIKSSLKKRKSLKDRKINNVRMMSECDDVLRNDFKWLINFNLKDLPITDIDKELPRSKQLKGQRRRRRRDNVIKHKHRLPLSDVIEQCLFIKQEATIKEINKWISDAFPCFKSNGCTWKNSVRKTLLCNPIFKTTKLKLGKSDLWCLDEKYLRDSSYVKETLHQNGETSVCENDMIKPPSSNDLTELTTAIQTIQESISYDSVLNTINVNDIHGSDTEMHNSVMWIVPGDDKGCMEAKDQDLIKCCEIPADFLVENGESVAIHFLDGTKMPINVELF